MVLPLASLAEASSKWPSPSTNRNWRVMSGIETTVSRLCAHLTCPLCDQLLSQPCMATECGHVFCQACVMQAVQKARICPTCHLPILVKNLRLNASLSTIVACTSKLSTLMTPSSFDQNVKPESNSKPNHLPDLNIDVGNVETFQENHPLSQSAQPSIDLPDLFPSQNGSISEPFLLDLNDDTHPSSLQSIDRKIHQNLHLTTPQVNHQNNPFPIDHHSASKDYNIQSDILDPNLTTNPTSITPITSRQHNPRKRISQTDPPPSKRYSSLLPTIEIDRQCQTPTPTVRLTRKNKLVILTTGLKDDQKEIIAVSFNKIGHQPSQRAILVKDYSHAVTHLISACDGEGLCARTAKYLRAILDGKLVVSYDWFLASLSANEYVKEEDYLVRGDEVIGGTTEAVRRSIDAHDRKEPPLFAGLSFFLDGTFTPPAPSRTDLATLISVGGGQLLSRRPTPNPQIDQSSSFRTIIIHDPKKNDPCNDDLHASWTWLLDCISHYCILPLSKRLSHPLPNTRKSIKKI